MLITLLCVVVLCPNYVQIMSKYIFTDIIIITKVQVTKVCPQIRTVSCASICVQMKRHTCVLQSEQSNDKSCTWVSESAADMLIVGDVACIELVIFFVVGCVFTVIVRMFDVFKCLDDVCSVCFHYLYSCIFFKIL